MKHQNHKQQAAPAPKPETPPAPPPEAPPAQPPNADAILAAAASTAQPDAQPKVTPQPEGLAAELAAAAEPPAEPVHAVYSLESAIALPEIAGPAFVAFESDDPRAILAFKDANGRTMRVALATNGMAKIHVNQEQQ